MLIYELAYNLHMPVYKLVNEMPYEELLNWSLYFKSRPVGWRDDNRTYMMLAAQGVKEKPHRLFESLAAIKREQENLPEQERIKQSLVSSGLLNRLQSAASSNNIEWEIKDG